MSEPEERIIRTDYSEIMQKNYIDYAMSVIVSRALPDVRDGLKPVQRRVLYDMWELGTRSDRPYRKSARIVGDTMGKYHPHGDSSIYDALVVLSQDFKKGRVLVDGHGNFGSIEGDGAAAMRYTEARLEKFTEDVFLKDLDKDIVDFQPNFDETEKEPTVLPARLPNVLVNGSDGIAVGMATSVPPHNISEVIDAVSAMIKNPDITEEELFSLIKGPDFPTGGIVVNRKDLAEIYRTGSGKLRIRGKVEIEKGKGGRVNIVVTEIPYTMIGSGIGKFLNDVALLAESRQAPEIADISNQSGKEGIRIVIECRKGTDTDRICGLLYKKTRLEDTFGVNMLMVSDGRPETMPLKKILEASVDFQFEIAGRKYENLLAKELEQKEVQEGLIRATDVIDLIIEILRGSGNRKMATDCLVLGKTDGIRFKTERSRKQAAKLLFTERQANAILDMRLVKLIGLEIEALEKEYGETCRRIDFYRDLLEHHDSMAKELVRGLAALRKEYGCPRRTELTDAEEIVIEAPPVAEEEVIFCLDRFGYARVLECPVYEKNKEACDSENRYVFRVMNTDRICLFTAGGRMHTVKVADVPVKKLRDKGVPVDNLSNFSTQQEELLAVFPMSLVAKSGLFFATRKGMVKRMPGSELASSVRSSVQSTKLQEGDSLLAVIPCDAGEQIVLVSRDGYFLRFPLSEVTELRKNAVGVRGMDLAEDDELESACLLGGEGECPYEFRGETLALRKIRLGRRGGKGIRKIGRK